VSDNGSLVNEIVAGVREDGCFVAKSVFSKKQCAYYKEILDKVLGNLNDEGKYVGNETYQLIYHYFSHDFRLIDLVDHSLIVDVMRQMIDQDFVLISPSARNRQISKAVTNGAATSGEGWHNDTRFGADGRTAFRPSMNYYAVVLLDDFTVKNGATQIVLGSHKLYQRPASRRLEEMDVDPSRLSHLVGPSGSIAFFDAALWHAVGSTTDQSRWGVFNMYGPWFMKPYFDFSTMFTHEQFSAMSPIQRQVLHYDSLVPANASTNRATLRRVQEKLSTL